MRPVWSTPRPRHLIPRQFAERGDAGSRSSPTSSTSCPPEPAAPSRGLRRPGGQAQGRSSARSRSAAISRPRARWSRWRWRRRNHLRRTRTSAFSRGTRGQALIERDARGDLRRELPPAAGDGQGPRAYLDRQPYFQQMPRFLIHETAIHYDRHVPVPARRGERRVRPSAPPQPSDPGRGRRARAVRLRLRRRRAVRRQPPGRFRRRRPAPDHGRDAPRRRGCHAQARRLRAALAEAAQSRPSASILTNGKTRASAATACAPCSATSSLISGMARRSRTPAKPTCATSRSRRRSTAPPQSGRWEAAVRDRSSARASKPNVGRDRNITSRRAVDSSALRSRSDWSRPRERCALARVDSSAPRESRKCRACQRC